VGRVRPDQLSPLKQFASSRSPRPGPNTLGFLAAAAAAVLWGLSGVVVKVALRGALDQGALLVLRLVLSVVLLGAGIAVFRPWELRARGAPMGLLVGLGVVMVALQYFYYRTIHQTSVGTAVFLEFLAPVFVVGYGWATGRQARERWSALAVISALTGGFLLVTAGRGLQLPLIALGTGLGAALALAGQTLLLDRLPAPVSRLGALWVALSVSALLSLVVGDVSSLWRTAWTWPVVGAVAYMAAGATVIPLLLVMAAVRRMGAARTGVTGTLEPVVAALGAWTLLGERLLPVQVLGGLMIVGAVGLIHLAPPQSTGPRETRG
jgi:drug/metabolite transporter (DMT)-like permease